MSDAGESGPVDPGADRAVDAGVDPVLTTNGRPSGTHAVDARVYNGAPVNPKLPDVLAPGLRVVFCGTAAGNVSAARGCYYAHPQNKFWRALFEAGLTPRLMAPQDYPLLPSLGLGLTDIAKSVSGMDSQLPAGALGRAACLALERKVTIFAPRILAFTSLNAGRRFLRRPAAMLGEQPERFGDTRIWLLPSPSPAANWNWDVSVWRALGEAAALDAPSSRA